MYADVITGIKDALETLDLVNVLPYEPATVSATPMAYIMLDGWERGQQAQVVTMRYQVKIRLVLVWQDNEAVEQQLIPYVNSIPTALEVDMTLGAGPEERRISQVRSGVAEYRDIGGITYRTMDTTISVLEKGASGSGL